MDIGTKLKAYRKALNLTGEELAVRSGAGQSTISEIENNKRSPSIETLEKLCAAMGIHLIDFLSIEQHYQKPSPELIELIMLYHQLSSDQQEKLRDFLRSVIDGLK